jgi:hypothetical protein
MPSLLLKGPGRLWCCFLTRKCLNSGCSLLTRTSRARAGQKTMKTTTTKTTTTAIERATRDRSKRTQRLLGLHEIAPIDQVRSDDFIDRSPRGVERARASGYHRSHVTAAVGTLPARYCLSWTLPLLKSDYGDGHNSMDHRAILSANLGQTRISGKRIRVNLQANVRQTPDLAQRKHSAQISGMGSLIIGPSAV